MTAYIGPLGALVEFECPSSLAPTTSRAASSRASATGVIKEQQAPRTNRQWQVGIGLATPSQIAGLAALVEGEFGPGPFWFVDPWAAVTNLMTPRASTLQEGYWATVSGTWTPGGSYVTDDTGQRVGSTLACPVGGSLRMPTYPQPNGATPTDFVPVIPGRPVTCSVWMTGVDADIRVIFRDAYGDIVSRVDSAPQTIVGGRLRRVHVSTTAPIGAAGVEFRPRNARQVARPAVTWTSAPVDWHVGQGAPRTTVTGLDQDVIMAIADPSDSRRYTGASFTVREVGV